MLAVILAGGKGTRLKPFTATIPKPLLPVGDIPILEVVIQQLVSTGFTRIALTLNHMAHLFMAVIGDGSRWGIKIDYYIEDKPLGTAGAIKLVNNLDDNFLVMNGDLLTTIDYRALFDFHVKNQASGTIATNRRNHFVDFGVLDMDTSGKLISYNEKPSIMYQVSMGINILSRNSVSYIPDNEKFDMPDLMMTMKEDNKAVFCYSTDCYWQDIGRVDDFQKASDDFTSNPEMFLS
ncbi:MAG: sugar phosphate nucleotidyltransferase [Spirochaetia bacterium]|nr:sugar phosphate nucleotidyltransferase [Spirochaetia bacterium]